MNKRLIGLIGASLFSLSAHAATQDDAKGLWLTAERDAVIKFALCDDKPTALCGTIVWDIDVGTAKESCGLRVIELANYKRKAWRDGFVYDPRDGKKYKGALRVKRGQVHLRAFVGTEMMGETSIMSPVKDLKTLDNKLICKKA